MTRIARAAGTLLLALLSACLAGVAPGAAGADAVRVAAAASLQGALDEAARNFKAATGRAVVITYAASSALARQAEAGAPFDVFVSADLEWMDYLEQRNRIDRSTRRSLLGNSLVLVAPANRAAPPLRIGPGFALAAALGDGKLAMANPDAVPAGKYGKAALEALGVWKAVERNVARAENVRAALALVARAEAPYGIVYRTDALADPGVRIVDTFPARTHPVIVYPAAALKAGNVTLARAFLDYLAGRPAEAVWRRYGFIAPE